MHTDPDALLSREWLVTNGLGGYASGTVCGVPTRRYHGHLVAALPAPFGRVLMLGPVSEQVRLSDGSLLRFGGTEHAGGRLLLDNIGRLVEFRLEAGLPVWRYDLDGRILEKRVVLPHRLNTSVISYRLVGGTGSVRLKLRPAVHFRSHDGSVNAPLGGPIHLGIVDDRIEVTDGHGLPPLRLRLFGRNTAFTAEGRPIRELRYRIEESRGYDSAGELWTPGYFRADLSPEESVSLVASCEPWETIEALPPVEAEKAERERRVRLLRAAHSAARSGPAADLVLAADQFIITPVGRAEEAARIRAAGDEPRSVIAGYHWFTDWGRDTMISLPGLTLATGRHTEAGYILRTFAHYVRDGLIPNFFPDGENQGVYHTADASLWFFQAVDAYLATTDDRLTLRHLLPTLSDIAERHIRGTRFGIGVDPTDGLLRQGAAGYQLTWMDAKVGDWVVTPRRGKAVEINALWYNALRLLAGWREEETGRGAGAELSGLADRCRASFNARFWNPATGHLWDVIDGEGGDDPACRPNQLFAFSLRHPVLDESRWPAVLEVVRERLLTPVGLRSLSPGHPDYKQRYFGDLRSRDAAYHQGTVWSWLIGPFVDCWLRVYPDDKAGARQFLEGLVPHLGEACVGSVSEVFDAEPPYTPRGCVAQAWGVAEALRCWVRTA